MEKNQPEKNIGQSGHKSLCPALTHNSKTLQGMNTALGDMTIKESFNCGIGALLQQYFCRYFVLKTVFSGS